MNHWATSFLLAVVYCTNREPAEYSGFEIELFRNVSAKLGWKPEMLEWNCMDWDTMVQHLKDNDGVCDIAVAGLEVSAQNVNDGILFTWPTYRYALVPVFGF
jgi:ABC-type amino acid transport substrate-binding protein